jgi:hypothetical protein
MIIKQRRMRCAENTTRMEEKWVQSCDKKYYVEETT